MIERFSKYACYFIFIHLCFSLYANIDYLKYTFDVLSEDYKAFSILNGAIADQAGYIMHMYDYGALGQMRMVKVIKTEIAVPDISNAPDVVKLVHLFFHRAPGTIGRGDFVFTDRVLKATEQEKKSIIQAIAWMMAQAKQLEKIASQSKKFEAGINQKMKAISLKDLDIKDEFEHLAYLANLEGSVSIIDILKNQSDSLKVFKVVWQAMQQEKGAKAIFPNFTTNTVLLAIVYRLAGANKNLLKDFYEKLNEIIRANEKIRSIFVKDVIPSNWVNKRFKPTERKKLGANLTFNAANTEKLKKYYESLVYLTLLPGTIPPEVSYAATYYHYDPADPTQFVGFADCMESTLRNVINLLVYDKDSVSFKLSKLRSIHPIAAFVEFYQKNANAVDVESDYLHNEWAALVSNIPFVAYLRKVIEHGTTAIVLDKLGFIKVPRGANVGDGYVVVGPDDIVYELQPSLRNTILVLNHLFQLDLFNHEIGRTPDEKTLAAFVRPDFIKTYFPQLCNKLNIPFKGFFDMGHDVTDIIDSMDYGPAIVTMLIVDANILFLITAQGHGATRIKAKEAEKKDPALLWTASNIQTIIDPARKFFEGYFYSLPYLAAYKNKWNAFNSEIDLVHNFNLIFYLPIHNADYFNDLISQLNRSKKQLSDPAIYLLSSLAKAIPDAQKKKLAELSVREAVIRSPNWTPKRGFHGIKSSSAGDIITQASQALKSQDSETRFIGRDLFNELLDKGLGDTEAIQSALFAIQNDQIIGFFLFIDLVGRGKGYPEAIGAASDSMKSKNHYFRNYGLELFKLLFLKGQGLPEAIQVASQAIKSDNIDIQNSALDLLKIIFNQFKNIPAEKLTPELKETIKKAIKQRKYFEKSTPGGKEFHHMAHELKRKIETK